MSHMGGPGGAGAWRGNYRSVPPIYLPVIPPLPGHIPPPLGPPATRQQSCDWPIRPATSRPRAPQLLAIGRPVSEEVGRCRSRAPSQQGLSVGPAVLL